MFPNPLNGAELHIRASQNIKSVEVVNILGQNIFAENNMFTKRVSINSSDFEKGVYLVRINFENGKSAVRKLLVN